MRLFEARYIVARLTILLCFIIKVTVSVDERRVCQDGWSQTSGHNGSLVCVKFYSVRSSWQEAVNICRQHYSSLLILDEWYFEAAGITDIALIKSQLDQRISSHEIWTGLHVSGWTLWWDGLQPTPFNSPEQSGMWSWDNEQPNITSQQQCAKASVRQGSDSMNFALTECDTELPFVCINSGLSTAFEQESECEAGWFGNPYSYQCLWASTQELSYNDAQALCESLDSHLVSPHTYFKQEMLEGFLRAVYDGVDTLPGMARTEPPVVPAAEPILGPVEPQFAPDDASVTPTEASVTADEPTVAHTEPTLTQDELHMEPDAPPLAPDEPLLIPGRPPVIPDRPPVVPNGPSLAPDEPPSTPDRPPMIPDQLPLSPGGRPLTQGEQPTPQPPSNAKPQVSPPQAGTSQPSTQPERSTEQQSSISPTTNQASGITTRPPSPEGQFDMGNQPESNQDRPVSNEPTPPIINIDLPQGPSNNMDDSSGIECIECTDATSEAECNAQATLVRCGGTYSVCQTDLIIKGSGEYRLSKKCESNMLRCTDRRQRTHQQCYGYRGVHTGIEDLICTECCISQRCNADVLSINSPHIYLSTIFSYYLIRTRHKRSVNQKLEIWLGLASDGMNFEWSNGAVYDSNTSRFTTLPIGMRGCVIYLDDGGTIVWEVIDCALRYRAVCQQTTQFEAITISKPPTDIATLTRRITWRYDIQTLGATIPSFSCDVSGYIPRDMAITWIKDGVYINNGFGPGGLRLNISRDLGLEMYGVRTIASLQGNYQCQLWSSKDNRYVRSKPALLIFQDVLTYRVELRLPRNAVTERLQHAVWTRDSRMAYYTNSLITLFTITASRVVLAPEVQLTSFRFQTLYFSLYYVLPNLQRTEWDNLLRSLYLLYYKDMPGQKINNLLDYLEKALLYEIQRRFNNSLHDANSSPEWYDNYTQQQLLEYNGKVFNAKSAVACPKLEVENEGMKIEFGRTVMGQSVVSKQVCLKDGHPYGKVKCLGDFTTGSYWSEIKWSMACSQVQKSEVTGILFELSQNEIQQPLGVAMQLESLTRQPDVLVYADVVYSSHILHGIASSYMPSRMVGESVVKSINNLMCVQKATLTQAQAIDKAPTRVLEAVETMSSMLDVGGRSLTELCQPNICIHIHNADAHHGSEMGRGIAVDKDDQSDSLSPHNVDSIPPTHASHYPDYAYDYGFFPGPPGAPGSGRPGVPGPGKPPGATEPESGTPDLSTLDTSLVLPDDLMSQMGDTIAADPSDPGTGELGEPGLAPLQERNSKDFDQSKKTHELETTLGLFLSHRMSRVTFAVYLKSHLFIEGTGRRNMRKDSEKESQVAVNSLVVASTMNGYRLTNLSHPVHSTFKLIQNISIAAHRCVWWDFAASGAGAWSTHGCWMDRVMDDVIVCACDHLTNFAVIADVEQTGIPRTHKTALTIISMLGIILSIGGLSLTILSYILFKKMRRARSQKVMFNLAISLLCLNVVFICGITRTENYAACIAVAAMLHYFLLVSFVWMLVEGVVHYFKFVKVLDTYVEKFMLKTAIPAWGGSAVVVIVVFAVDWKQYRGPDDYCWVDLQAFYYAVLVPIVLIIITNTVLFTLVIKGMTCDRPKGLTSTQSQLDLMWLRVRAAVCCFILLGVTWFFGFLAISDAKLVFQYVFCICNAFQGFLIFILHILREKNARDMWINVVCCRQNKGLKYRSTVTSHLGTHHSSKKDNSSKHKSSLKNDNNVLNTQTEKKNLPDHKDVIRQLSEDSINDIIYKRMLSASDSVNTQISDLSSSSRKTSDSSDFSSSLRRSQRLQSVTSNDSHSDAEQFKAIQPDTKCPCDHAMSESANCTVPNGAVRRSERLKSETAKSSSRLSELFV